MEKKRPRLLLICKRRSSFVVDDETLLEERYDVRTFVFDADRADGTISHAMLLVYYTVAQFFWLLRELPRADVVFGWFADYHTVLPTVMARRLGRPVVIVLGGYDANTLPAFGYGVFESSWQAPLARRVIRRATLLLPVADALVENENRYAAYPGVLQNGIRVHVPDVSTPFATVPTGYDSATWSMGPMDRGATVCTVALVDSERTLKVKGIDVLVEAARVMPDVTFRVVGVSPTFHSTIEERYDPPANVELLPPRPRNELESAYQWASVYVQLSRTEGTPNVLCEAMCCGCVPVGSPVAGIPDVIGEAGFLVETPDPEHVAGVLRYALDRASPERRWAARQRIERVFPVDRRRKKLFGLLDAAALASSVEPGPEPGISREGAVP